MTGINETLRQNRIRMGKRAYQMAQELGLNKSTISRLENGKMVCPKNKIAEVARAYGVSQEELTLNAPILNVHDTNIADVVNAIGTLRLDVLTQKELEILIGLRRNIGKPFTANLLNELLRTIRQ